jgi:hypothetical protein
MSISELAKSQRIDNALVFMDTPGSYRTQLKQGIVDKYPKGFVLNDPDLSRPVIYARDLGSARNTQLAKYFPSRKLYWLGLNKSLEKMEFIPLEEVQSRPAP